jgi:DNA-binding LacI/PurR family transcriptional regulator
MTDVAKLAGVSHQTVSRVLNDHPNVREQTRNRVRAAITALGYRPNRAARTLATGTSQAIGVVSRGAAHYRQAAMFSGIAQAAHRLGLTIITEYVPELDRRPAADAISRLLDQRVEGLVVITPADLASDALEDVPPDIPLVTIDGEPDRATELVTVDQEAGAYVATTHLLEAGHRTVWHVTGPKQWFGHYSRLAGWQRALTEHDADIPPPITADWSAASGYQAGQILARTKHATAVFAANDHLALGIIRAMHEQRRRVPRDFSVVGFDDVPEAAYFIPPLTTIRPDYDAVVNASLELLLAQIRTGCAPPERLILKPALIRRSSVSPPHD